MQEVFNKCRGFWAAWGKDSRNRDKMKDADYYTRQDRQKLKHSIRNYMECKECLRSWKGHEFMNPFQTEENIKLEYFPKAEQRAEFCPSHLKVFNRNDYEWNNKHNKKHMKTEKNIMLSCYQRDLLKQSYIISLISSQNCTMKHCFSPPPAFRILLPSLQMIFNTIYKPRGGITNRWENKELF